MPCRRSASAQNRACLLPKPARAPDETRVTMKRSARHAAACAAFLPMLSTAQVAPATPDPRDAGAAVPPLQYRSAFSDYRPYDESPRADWREVNRTVDEVARKIGQGAPGASTAATTATGASGGGHGAAHGGQGGHGASR
jgi:hypothetical protein